MSALRCLRPGTPKKNVFTLRQMIFNRRRKSRSHPETPFTGEFDVPPKKGRIVDKKPFPMTLETGKKYAWCTCGESHKQPFCDGSHKIYKGEPKLLNLAGKFSPHRFEVTETKKYWLCMCKQTNNRPFCDGSHQDEVVQKKIKS